MNLLFSLLLLSGVAVQTVTQGGDAALSSLLSGAEESVQLLLGLAGAYLFWMGLMGVVRRAGLMDALSRALRPAIRFLFPRAGDAAAPISLNLAANMLGMGNAATPFGLEAMRLLQQENARRDTATDEMCTLLCINASCLELLPTTMIALRQAAGSVAPAAIVLPTLLSSACATAAAVVLVRLLTKR